MKEHRIRTELVDRPSKELTEAFRRLLPQLSTHPPEDVAAHLLRVLASGATRLLVARDESGHIVGTLTLVIFAIPSGTRAWIEDVVVDEGARGKGVGSSLLRDALERATAEGVKSIDLTSRASRIDANRLYEQLGFVRRDSTVYRFQNKPGSD
jgi:ribosomal protein S18 acetylase RimI-like enzyme